MLSEKLRQEVMKNSTWPTGPDPDFEFLEQFAPAVDEKQTTIVKIELTSGVPATVTVKFT